MGKHKKKKKPGKINEPINLPMAEVESILRRASTGPLSEGDLSTLRAALETLLFLTQELEKKNVSLQRLRQMLFGSPTETADKIIKTLEKAAKDKASQASSGAGGQVEAKAGKPKGHGRIPATAYTGAQKVVVTHPTLHPGDCCPTCAKGKVYGGVDPHRLVRLTGQPPIGGSVYEMQRLRCGACGEVFEAPAPEGVGEEKYDAESASMIAVMKYGTGLPFNRLEKLEGSLGIPLPASDQWEIVQEASASMLPAFDELVRQAAQGEVLHNDDTDMKVLSLGGSGKEAEPGGYDIAPSRKGVFTSGIVSIMDGRKAALFFTGRRHAGENLGELLKKRAADLGPPIQMCDALSRNVPEEMRTILSNCLVHGRRKFVEVVRDFPDECLHVIEIMKDVFRNDAVALSEGMSKEERLVFHQAQSGPKMAELEAWMAAQIDEKKVEPNSGLGDAIAYMRKHWPELTLFLRVPGAPLQNNICERILKKAILHRKNAYFFKTSNGARVGDLFMSLIHTCELNGANPFEYLTALQKHADAVAAAPADWMPWNYPAALGPACAKP